MAQPLASEPHRKLFHLTYRYMICFSISAPFPWGTRGRVDTAPKASGCILGGTQRIHREEPGKQKTRSCRAQELSRSRGQGRSGGNGNKKRSMYSEGPEGSQEAANAESVASPTGHRTMHVVSGAEAKRLVPHRALKSRPSVLGF